MVLSLVPGVALAAEGYSDTNGHWAETAIERWSGHGVVQGNNGAFDPNGQLTRGQMAVILARLLNLPAAPNAGFVDVPADAWYADAINRCYAAGILLGSDGKAMPNDPITREQAMVMLGRALGIEPVENPDLSKYPDAGKVAAYARGYVAALIEAGIISGTPDGSINPEANIDRASTVTILDRAISVYADKAGESVNANGGIVIIVADNVTVTAGEGTTVIVVGGGVTVKGEADNVIVTGENASVKLNGADVQKVTVTGKDAEVTASNGAKVDTVTVSDKAEGTTVNAGSGTTIGTVENEGEDTTVTGSGKVEKVESSEDVTVETKGTTVENTGDGEISVTDKNGKETTVDTGASSTTNSSTGSSSSGGSYTPSAPSHTHTFRTDWVTTDTHHWHKIDTDEDASDTCTDPDAKGSYGAHIGAAATCTTAQICSVCEFEMAPELGHDFVKDSEYTDTETNTVIYVYKCSRTGCNETMETESTTVATLYVDEVEGDNDPVEYNPETYTHEFTTLEAAVTAANAIAADADGKVRHAYITLLKDVEVNAQINFSRKNVNLDGGGHTITAKVDNGTWNQDDETKHLINLSGDGCGLFNVTLDCGGSTVKSWGLSVYHCEEVSLRRVTITNVDTSSVYAPLTINGALVYASDLDLPTAKYGSINVDANNYTSGKTGLYGSGVTVAGAIWTDGGNSLCWGGDDTHENGKVAVELPEYSAVWTGSNYLWTKDVSVCEAVVWSTKRDVWYYKLADAAAKATANENIQMLKDVKNEDLSNVVALNLAAGVGLEGDGHTIEGNIRMNLAAAGKIGIHKVNFKNIHNDTQYTSGYGFATDAPKTGTLSAIYAPGLTGGLDILECTFDSVDWDAIQITPAAGAKINIRGNTFKTTSETIKPIRYVHIESAGNSTTGVASVDFAAHVNGNRFLDVSKLNQTGLEVYWAPDDALNGTDPKLNLSGNYMDAPMAVCIGIGQGADAFYNYNNAWYAAYDFFEDSADVNKENPDDSDFYSRDDMYMISNSKGNMLYTSAQAAVAAGAVAAVNKGEKGNVAYTTLAAAVAAAEPGDTVTLLKNAEGDGIVIAEGKFKDDGNEDNGWEGLTIDFGGHTYTVSGALVGSKSETANYQTSGFQILKDNTVTLQNGTLTTSNDAHKGDTEEKRPATQLIQNYADLTLNSMTLTGVAATAEGVKSTEYVLSNNCGNVWLDGCTITAATDQYALDVYGDFGDYDDVHVTVKGGTISGNISVDRVASSENNNANTLAMDKNVTFTGKLIVANYKTAEGENDGGTWICVGVANLDADPWVGTEINENGTYLFADGVMQTSADTYQISNLEGLKWLHTSIDANKVMGSTGEMFSGKTFQITANIDATGYTWDCLHLGLGSTTSAVNGFTIDGMGHAINNLTITGQGLFTGYASGTYEGSQITTIKGITFNNVTLNSSDAYHVGVIWGELAGELKLDSVKVTNSAITGKCNVAALVGRNSGDVAAKLTFTSCNATGNTITAAGGDGADPNGASAFLGSALTNGNAFTLTFGEGNTQSGNAMTQAAGQVGGGVYATWNTTGGDTSRVDAFESTTITAPTT